MMACILWSVFTWTFKGILCTCRFLWICPYNAVKFLPRKRHMVAEADAGHLKHHAGCESKVMAAIPGSPDRTAALSKRLTKTEKDILTLRNRMACERASWERRFAELQRKQEDICSSLVPQAAVLLGAGDDPRDPWVNNGESLECSTCSFTGGSEGSLGGSQQSLSSSLSSLPAFSSTSSSSSVSSVMSRRSSGPQRAFVPHSPMDLQLGQRVRVMLPSGRISTGTVRFLGLLQGEADLHLGVELQTPHQGLHDGSLGGQKYFNCEPGCGAFVPFHKLLMAWE